MIMIESEGLTENVKTWRTEVPANIVVALIIKWEDEGSLFRLAGRVALNDAADIIARQAA